MVPPFSLGLLLAAVAVVLLDPPAEADHTSLCTVASVVDGDTFDCTDGTRVRLLQINTPELNECGGQWVKAALGNIFLTPGRQVRLDYDTVVEDRYDRHLAAPLGQ
jgi:endonuclease YncB( thermonuclease family)